MRCQDSQEPKTVDGALGRVTRRVDAGVHTYTFQSGRGETLDRAVEYPTKTMQSAGTTSAL